MTSRASQNSNITEIEKLPKIVKDSNYKKVAKLNSVTFHDIPLKIRLK